MNRLRNPLLLLVIFVALTLAPFGCSGAKGTEAGDGHTPDQAIQRVMTGLSGNRPEVLWQALPGSYRQELTSLVHEGAAKMDVELWNRSFGVVQKLGRLLGEKRSFILEHPMLASQVKDRGEAEANWDAVVGLLDAVASSELADLETLQKLDIGEFLRGTGRRLMERMAEASALTTTDSYASQMRDLAATRVTVLSSEGDHALVRIETPGRPAREEDYRRVEGKWISKKLADGWPAEMARAREALASFSGEEMHQNKQAVMMQLSMFEAALDQLLAAKTPGDFNDALGATLGMAMGAIMASAAQQGLSAESASPIPMITVPTRAPEPQEPDMDLMLAGAMHGNAEDEIPLPPVSGDGTIALGDLDGFVGHQIRVKGKNGLDTTGRLQAVSGDALSILKEFGSGSMSIEVSKRDVERIELIRR